MKIGINGLGRIGRLVIRAALDDTNFEIVQLNDPSGDAETFAHLLNFDSVHGQWQREAKGTQSKTTSQIEIDSKQINFNQVKRIDQTDWSACDIVIDASGVMKTQSLLNHYLKQGVKKVLVCAPVKEPGVLNIVYGVNADLYDNTINHIVTAASCTTNCMAPVVKVIHESLGIRHGSMTTIHDITNTQTILDAAHKDLRRARACGMSLIPTTTGSATAITHIFPELKGRLNGHAVRVPLANASLTDMVFEVERKTSEEEVNKLLETASKGKLAGILGYEERPLVSIDYRTDPRSGVIDALSTMVVNDTQVKLYAWYDNEWGYANRVADIVQMIQEQL